MTEWSNSVNGTYPGVQTINNGLWTGSIFNQYAVLVGSTNNTITGINAVNTSGYVLTNNGVSANPSYQPPAFYPLPWTVVTGTSQSCLVTNGYIASNAGTVDMYLPATAAIGNEIKFANIGTGFAVVPASGQTLNYLSQYIIGPGYFITSTANAALDIVCSGTNSTWNVVNSEGTFTPFVPSIYLQASISSQSLMYLKANGSGWGTGGNTSGQLGNNTTTSYSSPVSVVGNFNFTQISTQQYVTTALRSDGTCWAWGYNVSGQLGNNSNVSTSSPISVLGGITFIEISNGGSTTGGGFCTGLSSIGNVWAWGVNSNGQLGNNTINSYSSPISVVGNHSFIQISAGFRFMAALKIDGSCWAWGYNATGQLGNQSVTAYSSPVSVVGNHSFIQIACCNGSMFGLKIDGSCWGWGTNTYGQLGNQTVTGYSSPISVVGAHSFIQIAATQNNAYGLKSNGQIWSWGNNTYGQIGNNTITSYSSPVSVVGPVSFTQLGFGGQDGANNSICAWTSTGQLWAWGYGSAGILGNNTATSYSSPILVLNTP